MLLFFYYFKKHLVVPLSSLARMNDASQKVGHVIAGMTVATVQMSLTAVS